MKTPTLTQRPQIVANEDFNGTTNSLNAALREACKKGNEEVVNHLIAAKVDVNVADIYRFTPLMIASQAGHEAIVEKLIQAGADIKVKSEHGKTALMLACSRGHIYIAKKLIEAGATIDRHSSESEIFAGYILLMMIIRKLQAAKESISKRKRDQDDEAIGKEKSAKTLLFFASNHRPASSQDKSPTVQPVFSPS
jgi:ankyrin repeat protein